MILEDNTVVEVVLPSSVLRDLTDEEMHEYRHPYKNRGEDRCPTLTWPRQLPIGGEPADFVKICKEYDIRLAQAPGIPKLFVNAEPGTILTGPQRELCRT